MPRIASEVSDPEKIRRHAVQGECQHAYVRLNRPSTYIFRSGQALIPRGGVLTPNSLKLRASIAGFLGRGGDMLRDGAGAPYT